MAQHFCAAWVRSVFHRGAQKARKGFLFLGKEELGIKKEEKRNEKLTGKRNLPRKSLGVMENQ